PDGRLPEDRHRRERRPPGAGPAPSRRGPRPVPGGAGRGGAGGDASRERSMMALMPRRRVLLLAALLAGGCVRAQAGPPPEPGRFRDPDLVELTSLDPGIKLDVRYATDRNFVGRPVYSEARAFLQRPAAEALLRALLRAAMEQEGFTVEPNEWWHFNYRDWRHYPILDVPFSQIAQRP